MFASDGDSCEPRSLGDLCTSGGGETYGNPGFCSAQEQRPFSFEPVPFQSHSVFDRDTAPAHDQKQRPQQVLTEAAIIASAVFVFVGGLQDLAEFLAPEVIGRLASMDHQLVQSFHRIVYDPVVDDAKNKGTTHALVLA